MLRIKLGLGNPILVQTDSLTGYRVQPNQKTVRFGNHIEYNQYSQRSDPIEENKPPETLRILMVGDSVLNGNHTTDQKETISEFLEAKLSASGQNVEVLNASVGSWGIGNQLGYLQKFGTFESDLVILQIGTHDLVQPKSTGDRVGNQPDYPNQQPLLAITEGINRYIMPKIRGKSRNNTPTTEIPKTEQPSQQFQQNQQYFQTIVSLIREQKTPLVVLFTPNRVDVLPNSAPPSYKTNFLELISSLKIPLIDSHIAWSKLPPETVEGYFYDRVHLTASGNQAIADLIFQENELLPKITN